MRKKQVLIIYTGGTFGMEVTRSGAVLGVGNSSSAVLRRRFLERVPEIKELADCDVEIALNRDSAHVGSQEWVALAALIRKKLPSYDGVVLLHGTDTLAYTAAALSFLLPKGGKGMDKPIVLTGAQRPLLAIRTDARRNLMSAVEIAAEGRSVGVSVFFDDHLFSGSRVRKRSASEFQGFESPKFPPLAVVGTTIRYLTELSPKRAPKLPAKLKAEFSRDVALLHMTPGFPASAVAHGLLPEISALVLVIFESGTAPTNDPRLLALLDQANDHGVPVVLVTEGVSSGSESGTHPANYAAGKPLLRPGCYWAGDMTPEAAYVKTSLILGQGERARAEFAKWWNVEFAGEGCVAENPLSRRRTRRRS